MCINIPFVARAPIDLSHDFIHDSCMVGKMIWDKKCRRSTICFCFSISVVTFVLIGCTTIASIHYADDDPSGYLGLVRTSVNVYEVPFQYSPMNSAIIVNLKLNGSTSYPFIFDTGAGQCVIDWGMVEKLALRSLVQDAPVTDAGGAWRKMRLYSAVSVKLSIGAEGT